MFIIIVFFQDSRHDHNDDVDSDEKDADYGIEDDPDMLHVNPPPQSIQGRQVYMYTVHGLVLAHLPKSALSMKVTETNAHNFVNTHSTHSICAHAVAQFDIQMS